MLNAEQMRSLPLCFSDIKDPRRPQGRRHRLPVVLGIAAGATLCGMSGYKGMANRAGGLEQQARERFGCRHENKRYVVPSEFVIRDCLVRGETGTLIPLRHRRDEAGEEPRPSNRPRNRVPYRRGVNGLRGRTPLLVVFMTVSMAHTLPPLDGQPELVKWCGCRCGCQRLLLPCLRGLCGDAVLSYLRHVCQGIMYIRQSSRLPCFGNIFCAEWGAPQYNRATQRLDYFNLT